MRPLFTIATITAGLTPASFSDFSVSESIAEHSLIDFNQGEQHLVAEAGPRQFDDLTERNGLGARRRGTDRDSEE